jgi:hypothetical protein
MDSKTQGAISKTKNTLSEQRFWFSSPQAAPPLVPWPSPAATMNGGGQRRYSSEQLLFDVPANAGAGRSAQQVRPPALRDLRGVRVFRLLGDALIGADFSVRAAWRGAARRRGDLRVGGAGYARAAAGRGRRGWGLAGAEAAAQPRPARSPRLRHRANPRRENNHRLVFLDASYFPLVLNVWIKSCSLR